jgi:hypothetical protein
MDLITADTVEKTYTRMWNMPEQEAYKLSYVMQKEQPLLAAYLAAVDEDVLNKDEREVLFYLGTVIWQIMSSGEKPLPKIKEDALLTIEKENLKIAESLKSSNTVTFAEVIKRILRDYHQPEVFKYVVATLIEEDDEECNIKDEHLGIIMLDLKTVIDVFDQ